MELVMVVAHSIFGMVKGGMMVNIKMVIDAAAESSIIKTAINTVVNYKTMQRGDMVHICIQMAICIRANLKMG
jgi:hypothetical protein